MELIVATDQEGGIGKNGKIPWYCQEDIKRFKELTTGVRNVNGSLNCVVMGRKTWESIGRPLPNRINIVVSRTLNENNFRSGDNKGSYIYLNKPDFIAKNKQEVLDWVRYNNNTASRIPQRGRINKVFFIGGSEIYKLFMDNVNIINLTIMKNSYNCDTFFNLNQVYNNFKLIKVEPLNNHVNLTFIK